MVAAARMVIIVATSVAVKAEVTAAEVTARGKKMPRAARAGIGWRWRRGCHCHGNCTNSMRTPGQRTMHNDDGGGEGEKNVAATMEAKKAEVAESVGRGKAVVAKVAMVMAEMTVAVARGWRLAVSDGGRSTISAATRSKAVEIDGGKLLW